MIVEIQYNQILKVIQLNEILPVFMDFCKENKSLIYYNYSFELVSIAYKNLFSNNELMSNDWKVVLNSTGNYMIIKRKRIVVMCRNYIYCLNLNGHLIWQNKLEYDALYCDYYNYDNDRPNPLKEQDESQVDQQMRLAVLSNDAFLFIYKNIELIWAAKCD